MRGYCRKCRTEWTGADQFAAHVHRDDAHRCPCGQMLRGKDDVCAACELDQAVAS